MSRRIGVQIAVCGAALLFATPRAYAENPGRARVREALLAAGATPASPLFLLAGASGTAHPKLVAPCTDVVLVGGANAVFRSDTNEGFLDTSGANSSSASNSTNAESSAALTSHRGVLVVRHCLGAANSTAARDGHRSVAPQETAAETTFAVPISAFGAPGAKEAVGAIDVFSLPADHALYLAKNPRFFEALLPERAPLAGPDVTSLAPPVALALAPREASSRRDAKDAGYTFVAQALANVVAVPGTEKAVSSEIGRLPLHLTAGCHRLDVLVTTTALRYDADADVLEARSGDEPRILASDKGDGADPRLALCVGSPTDVVVRVTGYRSAVGTLRIMHYAREWFSDSALRRAETNVSTDGRTKPGDLSPALRAAIATALLGRGSLEETPDSVVFQRRGIVGRVVLTVPVVPGHCYLLGAAATNGTLDRISVAASGDGYAFDDRGGRGTSAEGARAGGEDIASLAAFCAESEIERRVQIAAFGRSVVWEMALLDTFVSARGSAGSENTFVSARRSAGSENTFVSAGSALRKEP